MTNQRDYANLINILNKRFGKDYTQQWKNILIYMEGFGHGIPIIQREWPNSAITIYARKPVADWQGTIPLTMDLLDPVPAYDLILCVNIVNTLLPEDRQALIQATYNRLLPDGYMVVVAPSWYAQVNKQLTKNARPAAEHHALHIPRVGGKVDPTTTTYQKGYDFLELLLEIEWYLTPFAINAHQLSTRGPNAVYVRKGKAL